jgi:hypothetical protein
MSYKKMLENAQNVVQGRPRRTADNPEYNDICALIAPTPFNQYADPGKNSNHF